ncbi:MAG: type II toxin-antitoxin system HicB family antitoxin [Candidatus Micrarchaeota archaeon]
MDIRNFHIVLEKQEEGGYTAYVPELPGCISQGDTEKETLKNIREAIALYLEELRASHMEKIFQRVKIIEPAASA